jgi:hypothetical protein
MKAPRNSGSAARAVLAAMIIGAALAACTVVGRSIDAVQPTDAGRQAWSDRLEAQAEAHRRAEIWQAWSERLNRLAEERGHGPGMGDQARGAWSERLTKLAEDLLAEQ